MDQYDVTAVRAKASEHYNGTDGFDNNSRKNAYECESCGSYIITVDREPGVTPFMVRCGNCGQMAKSKFYKVAAALEPSHEWYRPETLDGIPDSYLDHLVNGGLILRQIGGGDRKEGWQKQGTGTVAHVASRAAEIARIESQQAELLRKMAEPSPIRREDYPSRQAYRHAVTRHRKGRLS